MLATLILQWRPPEAWAQQRAEPGMQVAAAPESDQRSQIRFRALGPVPEARLSALTALIEAELVGNQIRFSVASSSEPVSRWVSQVQRDPRVLVIAVLDARQPEHWQVTIVDAARQRAIRRRLPGGLAEDAAALEAVASIVVSAVTALQDGLEVASRPVEEVLASETAALEPVPPTPSAAGSVDDQLASDRSAQDADAARGVVLRGAVLGSAASFAPDEPVSLGIGAGLGVTWPALLAFRVSAVRYREVVFGSVFGKFPVTRSTLALAAGPHFDFGRLELEPEARFVLDLIQRQGGEPAFGVEPLGEALTSRVGGVAAIRGRIVPVPMLSVELLVGAGYLPRPVSFVARPDQQEIAQLWQWLLLAELGVELALH